MDGGTRIMTAKSQKRAAVALQSLFHAMVAPKPIKAAVKRPAKPKKFSALDAMLQRCDMQAMRGNLTQAQAASVIGRSADSWQRMEYGDQPCLPGMLDNFRVLAAARFPHYRCDLKRI